jgi:hypothetical protein
LSSSATLTFINGVLNVDDLQAPFPDSLAFLANRPIYESAGNPVTLSPCVDRSRFAGPGTAFGPRLTFRGVHTQSYGSLYYVQRPQPGGQRRGISVFGPSTALTVGHRYKIAGRVQEFGGETEIVNTVYIVDEGPDAIPFPIQKPISVLANQTCDQAQNIETGEDYEGVLVKVSQARVVNFNTDPVDPSAGGSFRIVQPLVAATDTILVSSLGNHYTYDPTAGDIVDVTGILHEDGTFRILPRSDADIARGSAGVGGGQFDLALSVAPNPGIAHHIDFALPTKSAVELGVFDLAGRRVAVIASGVMEAGPHSATWNGLASNGSRAGAGMYFYRLKVGNELRTLRAVKLN